MIIETALAAVLYTAPACTDPVVNVLHSAGFRGRALRYAYGIVMRESKGHAIAVSARQRVLQRHRVLNLMTHVDPAR